MEQITLNSLHSGAFIRGSQALLLQNNNQNLNLSACLNGDIIQQALNGINTQIPSIPDMNSQKINIGQNSLIFDKEMDQEDQVVELSINDDFPLHLLNSSRNEDSIFNIDQQSILLEDVLNSANEKSDNSLDSFNNLLQLSPDTESNDIPDIPLPSVKGNFTYAYQLTNGTKLSHLQQNAPITIPVASSNGFTNSTPYLTSADANKPALNNQNTSKYIILRGVNIKPRLVLNLNKPKQEAAKNGIQKMQVIPVNGKIAVNKNPRNIAPQRVALPPLKKPKLKEATFHNPTIKTPINQEIKSKPAAVWLKSLLKPKSTDTLRRNNVSTNSLVQVNTNEIRVDNQEKLLQNVILQPHVANTHKFLSKSTESPVQHVIINATRVEGQEKILQSVILQPHAANAHSFLSKSNESSVQQGSTNETRVESQEKLLQNVILQPHVANVHTFLSKSTESTVKNNFLNDSGVLSQGKLLAISKPKVTKSSESHLEPNGRCTEDQLKKIQAAFQNGELNLDKNNASSVIYDEEAKIVCKLLYPEEFTQNDKQEKDGTEKNGKKSKKRKGRPANDKEKKPEEESQIEKKSPQKEIPRTRSGRLSRPPRYMFKDYKKISVDHSDISSVESDSDEKTETSAHTNPINIPLDKKGTWYRCPTCNKIYSRNKIVLHFDNYPHHGDPQDIDTMECEKKKMQRCSTCGKNYPGNRMLRHLFKYPDHAEPDNEKNQKKIPGNNSAKQNSCSINKKHFVKGMKPKKMGPGSLRELLKSCTDDVLIKVVKKRISKLISPWDFLVERQPAGDGAVRGLLSDLSEILKALPSEILEKTDSSNPNAIYINDDRLCQILNISPGSYLPNNSAIKPSKPLPVPPKKEDKLSQALNMSSISFLPDETSTKPNQQEGPVASEVWPLATVSVMSPTDIIPSNQSGVSNQMLATDQAMSSCTSQVLPTTEVLSTSQIISTSQVLPTAQVLTTSQIMSTNQVLSSCEMMSTNQVLGGSQVLSTGQGLSAREALSPPRVMSPDAMMSPPDDEDNLFGKDVDNPLDLDKKDASDLSDILLDKSSLDTVDEILNDRLNELMPLDVPSLSETQALASSIFSTNSLQLHGVSGSTEDLLKSLENLAPELPSVSEPADFDFTVLSTDFGTDR